MIGRMDTKICKKQFHIQMSLEMCENYLKQGHFTFLEREDFRQVFSYIEETNVICWYRRQEIKTLIFMSLGAKVDAAISELEHAGRLLAAYALDYLAMKVLQKSYAVLPDYMQEWEGLYPGPLHFLNEDEMREIPATLAQCNITDIHCNEAFVLIPMKTVVISTELQKTKYACEHICANCDNIACVNREAPMQDAAVSKKSSNQSSSLEDVWQYQGKNYNYGYQRIFGGIRE